MRAKFVNESFFNFRKNTSSKVKQFDNINWSHNFKDEKIIDIIKYKGVLIKLVKIGNHPQKYYAILPIKKFGIQKIMPYYSLEAAINSTKNYIDAYFIK